MRQPPLAPAHNHSGRGGERQTGNEKCPKRGFAVDFARLEVGDLFTAVEARDRRAKRGRLAVELLLRTNTGCVRM